MKKVLALLLAVLMIVSFCACGNSENTSDSVSDVVSDTNNETESESEAGDNTDASTLKIGIILVGDENEGYTWAHIDGIKKAAQELGIADNQILWKYSVLENESCHDAAVDLVDSGCTYIFSNSYGHQSFMQQAAEEYPEVNFVAATGDTAAASGLDNFSNAFTDVYEARYVSGVVAGMKLAELMNDGKITDPKIGYVGAYPYAEVVSGYTAFLLGIQSVVPEAYMEVVYTNSWFSIPDEAEAANTLMADGCVIIGQHADSTGAPSAVQAAYKEGKIAYSVGYNIDMLSVAPDAALTSATNCWDAYYKYAFGAALKGEKLVKDWSEGLEGNAVAITTLGASCAAGTAEKVEEVEAAIKSGELHVFDTSKFTVGGEHLASYDKTYGFEGNEMISDGYFHESELRSAPCFDIRIDGITENTNN